MVRRRKLVKEEINRQTEKPELISMNMMRGESMLKGALCVCLIVIAALGIAMIAVAGSQYTSMPDVSSDVRPVVNILKYKDSAIETAGEPSVKAVLAAAILTFILIAAILIIGCILSIGNWKKVLGYYFLMIVAGLVFLVVLIVLQASSIALWYQYYDGVDSKFRNGEYSTALLADIYNDFRDDTITGSEAQSIAWNKLFLQYKCCGVNAIPVGDRGDFQDSYWVRSGAAASQKIPTSCCVDATESSYSAGTTCKDNVNSGTYHETGCLSKIQNLFDFTANSRALLGLTITVILLEVAVICLSISYFILYIKGKQGVCITKPDNSTAKPERGS